MQSLTAMARYCKAHLITVVNAAWLTDFVREVVEVCFLPRAVDWVLTALLQLIRVGQGGEKVEVVSRFGATSKLQHEQAQGPDIRGEDGLVLTIQQQVHSYLWGLQARATPAYITSLAAVRHESRQRKALKLLYKID